MNEVYHESKMIKDNITEYSSYMKRIISDGNMHIYTVGDDIVNVREVWIVGVVPTFQF